MHLEIELTGEQSKAMQYLCDKWNRTHSIPDSGPKTIQDLFEEQCNFYIKQMLKTVLPVAIADDILVGLNDEQQAELISRTINHYAVFVNNELKDMIATPDEQKKIFRKLMDWILRK